jgi:hypothetical protein
MINIKDLAAGLMFAAIGLFFTLSTWFTLPVGRAFSMGPGYFPLVLGTVLIALGAAICLSGINSPAEAFGRVSWRGLSLVMGSIIFFGVAVRGLGFGPTLFISVLMASLSSGRLRWRTAIVVSLVLTVFCVGTFIYALGLPYPVIGRWALGARP